MCENIVASPPESQDDLKHEFAGELEDLRDNIEEAQGNAWEAMNSAESAYQNLGELLESLKTLIPKYENKW
jgi:hypothetical protein